MAEDTPQVMHDSIDSWPATVEFADDATVTTESTPLYPATDIAPRPATQPTQQIVLNSEQMSQYNYKPPRYLVLSLLTLIVFCFPLGLAALVCAIKVDHDWNAGHYEDARRSSRTAKLLSYSGIISGAVIIVGSLFVFVLIVIS